MRILRETKLLVVLTGGKATTFNPATLQEKKELVKSGARAIATNENEYIAVGVGKFVLFFYFDKKQLTFLPLKFGEKSQIHVNAEVMHLEWNKDTLGIMTQTGYLIIEHKNLALRSLCNTNEARFPNLLAFEDKWLAVVDDSISFFSSAGKPLFGCELDLNSKDRGDEIYDMFIYDYYLLIVRREWAEVYNLHDNKKPRADPEEHIWTYKAIQRIPIEKEWLPANREFDLRIHAIDGSNVFVICEADQIKNCDEGSNILYWRAIPYEERMKILFKEGSMEIAWDLYSTHLRSLGKDPESYEEEFKLEGAWETFSCYEYERAEKLFLEVNYDIRELLMLMPNNLLKAKSPGTVLKTLLDKTMSIRKRLENDLNAAKDSPIMIEFDGTMIENETRPIKISRLEKKIENLEFKPTEYDNVHAAGRRLIMRLTKEVRRRLTEKYNFNTDGDKVIEFVRKLKPLVTLELPEKQTLEEIITMVDTCLLKMYINEPQLQELYNFLTTVEVLKSDLKEIDELIKQKEGKDRTYAGKVCRALLDYRLGNYPSSLQLWKELGQETREIRDMGCKETCKILKLHIKDKKSVFTYARMVLVVDSEEGLKIFTENEDITNFISEDDTIDYLKGLESHKADLRERYLEYLTSSEEGQERFFTIRGLFYVEKIKSVKNYKADSKNPVIIKNRNSLYKFIVSTSRYNPRAILDEIRELNYYDEEVHLYTIQKLYNEALDSFMRKHSEDFLFKEVEEYCLNQEEPLLGLLFQKVIEMWSNKVKRAEHSKKADLPYIKLEKEAKGLEQYTKDFVKKYANNDKMNIEHVLKCIPENWKLTTDDDDDALLDFLIIAFNGKQGKEINARINKKLKEMEKLDTDSTLVKLQRSYIFLNPENMCRVCRKKLVSGKSLYIFPNGIVTHTACGKDIHVCPITKIKFAQKVYT